MLAKTLLCKFIVKEENSPRIGREEFLFSTETLKGIEHRYFPLKTGFLFSRKAVTASRKSSVPQQCVD